MSTQNFSDEISQIDSFLKQLRSGDPPVPTKDAGEFQQTPPVATAATATPKDTGQAQSSGRRRRQLCVISYICWMRYTQMYGLREVETASRTITDGVT